MYVHMQRGCKAIVLVAILFLSLKAEGYSAKEADADLNRCFETPRYWKGWCYGRLGIRYADSNLCDRIDLEDYRNKCLLNTALVNRNASACSMMKEQGYMDRCYREVAQGVNVSDSSPASSCILLVNGTYKEGCFVGAALASYNPGVCDYLAESAMRGGCYEKVFANPPAIINKGADLCQRLGEDVAKWGCLRGFATAQNDTTLCERIMVSRYKEECIGYFLAQNDSGYCIRIKDIGYRNRCYIEAAIRQGDKGMCTLVETRNQSEGRKARNDCILTVGIMKKDLRVCDSLSLRDVPNPQDMRDRCMRDVGIALNSITLCDEVHSQAHKAKCLSDVAAGRNDSGICMRIIDEKFRQDCLQAVKTQARSTINIQTSTCEGIAEPAGRDSCLADSAKKLKDPNICGRIGDRSAQKRCYDNLMEMVSEAPSCLRLANQTGRNICLIRVASKSGDISVCDLINATNYKLRQDAKNICLHDAAITLRNDSICERILGPLYANEPDLRSQCLRDVGSRSGQYRTCDKIVDSQYSRQCYIAVAKLMNQPEICDMIGDRTWRQACEGEFQKAQNRTSMCDDMMDSARRWGCISATAALTNKPVVCLGIGNRVLQDECFFNAAVKNRDAMTCDKIQEPRSRNLCIHEARPNV
jgi:hypothetical protein